MHIFINFWKLETENSLCMFLVSFTNWILKTVLSCQTSFSVLKIENCFWKQKIRGKNSYQAYPNFLAVDVFPFYAT